MKSATIADLQKKDYLNINDVCALLSISRDWQDAFDEFKATHDLETMKSDFADLLYILLITDKSNFPALFSRVQAVGVLSQIHHFISLMYAQQEKEIAQKK